MYIPKTLHKINWINEILKNGNDINGIFYIFYTKIQMQSSLKLFKVKGKDIKNPIGIASAFNIYL